MFENVGGKVGVAAAESRGGWPGADSIAPNDSRRGRSQSILNTKQPLRVSSPSIRMVRNSECEASNPINPQKETRNGRKKHQKKEYWCPMDSAAIADFGCSDYWGWSKTHKSSEARVYGNDSAVVHFHPHWSAGTAAVQGDKALDARRYYWELKLTDRVFGTSIMFGVGTRYVRMHTNLFTNLLGENKESWAMSHKGVLWHDGSWSRYTQPFRENEATVVGLLYDGVAGTLTYYKDGRCLGVAFRDLNKCGSTLYPYVSSTAAKTKITLENQRRDFVNLQDRCRDVISRQVGTRAKVSKLQLPTRLENYIKQAIPIGPTRRFQPSGRKAYTLEM